MLILPSRLHHQVKEPCSHTSPSTVQTSQDPQSMLQSQVPKGDMMISVLPPVTVATAKRPKLSLQTSPPSAQRTKPGPNLSFSTDSPTIRNAHVNAFEPSPSPSHYSPGSRGIEGAPLHHQPTPSSTSAGSSSASGHTSPFPSTTPYNLPLGARSILRNSPLPRRHVSATSARAPRRMFPPAKRVLFHEPLEETIPTNDAETIFGSLDSDSDGHRTEAAIKERRAIIEEEDGSATPVHGRRKRRREWVWRPLDDDILVGHHKDALDVVSPSLLERAGSSNHESQ